MVVRCHALGLCSGYVLWYPSHDGAMGALPLVMGYGALGFWKGSTGNTPANQLQNLPQRVVKQCTSSSSPHDSTSYWTSILGSS